MCCIFFSFSEIHNSTNIEKTGNELLKILFFNIFQYFSLSVLKDLVYNLENMLLYTVICSWCTLRSHYKENVFSLSSQERYFKIALKQVMNSAIRIVTPVQDGPANICRVTFWGHVHMHSHKRYITIPASSGSSFWEFYYWTIWYARNQDFLVLNF